MLGTNAMVDNNGHESRFNPDPEIPGLGQIEIEMSGSRDHEII